MITRFYAWRAALRIARRDAWRNKGRSALVALMIAFPVLALSTVSVLIRSDEMDPQDDVRVRLGVQAQAEITYWNGQSVQQAPDGRETFNGGSKERFQIPTWAGMTERIASRVPTRDRVLTDRTLRSSRNITLGDRLFSVGVREIDYTAHGVGGLIDQVVGRAPKRPGEVVITQELADKNIHVGDRLTYRASPVDPPKDMTVVGIVDGYDVHGMSEVIGPPGMLLPASAFTGRVASHYAGGTSESRLLVVGPDAVTWDDVLNLNQVGGIVLSRDVVAHPPSSAQVPYNTNDDSGGVNDSDVGLTAVVIGMVLLQMALLAGPAIAVGARRNQHSMALLASAGAERRHLRSVVLGTNGVIGLVSCGFAAIAGTGLGITIIGVLRNHGTMIVRIDVHLLDLLELVAVGVITAIGASLIPARQAAKVDVVAVLTGRRGFSPPALRVPLIGLLLTGAGTALALLGSRASTQFPTVLGLGLAEVGLVMGTGAVVALAARLAVRMPFSVRFALRDAARQRSRTAPAVAAVLAAIAGGSAALVYVAAQGDHDRQAYRPHAATGVVTIDVDGNSFDDAVPSLPKAEAVLRRELRVDSTTRFQTIQSDVVSGTSVGLTALQAPGTVCRDRDNFPSKEGVSSTADATSADGLAEGPCPGRSAPGTLDFREIFDDGTAVQALTHGAAPSAAAALMAGKIVTTNPELIWPDGTVHVRVDHWKSSGNELTSGRTVPLPAVRAAAHEQNLNGLVYPLNAARKLGVALKVGGLIATPSTLPTEQEEDRINDLLHRDAGVEMIVERGYVGGYGLVLLSLLVAATVISLIGTYTAVGLAAAETRPDVSTLAAVGASPGTRRRLAAAQAGVISGLGGVLGVASGILAGWVLIRTQSDYEVNFGQPNLWRFVLPWPYLFAVWLGIPALAMALAFLASPSRLPMVRRLGQ